MNQTRHRLIGLVCLLTIATIACGQAETRLTTEPSGEAPQSLPNSVQALESDSYSVYEELLGLIPDVRNNLGPFPDLPETAGVWMKDYALIRQNFDIPLPTTNANPESTEGRPWGQPLKKPAGAPLNLG